MACSSQEVARNRVHSTRQKRVFSWPDGDA